MTAAVKNQSSYTPENLDKSTDEFGLLLQWQDAIKEAMLADFIVNDSLEHWSASYSGPKFHAVLCDPPYGLEFMGKEWDAPHKASSFPKAGNLGGFADGNKPSFARQGDISRLTDVYRSWGEAILPHLYPGALVLMFGGTRTWHRLACGMEDAGFEMWDTLMWLHGQGFPKAQDISKLIDKQNGDERGASLGSTSGPNASRYDGERYHETRTTQFGNVQDQPNRTAPGSHLSAPWSGHKTTALKPAWEPVLCFKKPLTGTYAEMALQYGSGALNVDGGRIQGPKGDGVWGTSNAGCKPTFNDSPEQHDFRSAAHDAGRYPANLILDPESAKQLDEMTGEIKTHRIESESDCAIGSSSYSGSFQGNRPARGFTDSGGASRFYYCAKSSSAERNAGLEGFKARPTHGNGEWGQMSINAPEMREGRGCNPAPTLHRNHHPCCKPIDLCRYLAALLLPPDSVKPRRLLVPFAGSGSEMIGAMLAGWDEIVGIEQDKEHGYVPINQARMDWWKWAMAESRLTDPMAILTKYGFVDEPDEFQANLFEKKPEQMSL